MAFYLGRIYATCRWFPILTLTKVLPHFYSKFEVDVMDEFTSQLMQRKLGKWDHKRRKNESFLETTVIKLDDNDLDTIKVTDLNLDQLRRQFQTLFDNEDTEGVINLTKLCIVNKTTPPVASLMNILAICSQSGEKTIILDLNELCKIYHPDFAKENSNFRHFLAEAIWIKGDIIKSLEIFEEVYRENAYLRRRIRLMCKYLINGLIEKGSDAALSNMISFSERFLFDFQDFLPLSSIWQACFLSEWFSDQNTALDLLNKHSGLCKYVVNRIPYVVFVSLRCHRTEVVYRLLEMLLKYKMKPQYSHVVGALLDYQCIFCILPTSFAFLILFVVVRFGDWVRCSEIIKWAIDNDVPLPQNYNIQMINMILNQELETPLAPVEEKPKTQSKYNFKF